MSCARCEEWQRICENLESQITGLREDTADRIEALEASDAVKKSAALKRLADGCRIKADLYAKAEPTIPASFVIIADEIERILRAPKQDK